jgi:hypothetical protein
MVMRVVTPNSDSSVVNGPGPARVANKDTVAMYWPHRSGPTSSSATHSSAVKPSTMPSSMLWIRARNHVLLSLDQAPRRCCPEAAHMLLEGKRKWLGSVPTPGMCPMSRLQRSSSQKLEVCLLFQDKSLMPWEYARNALEGPSTSTAGQRPGANSWTI